MHHHRILILAPNTYGAFGGIAQYNRDVLDAMAENKAISEIVVLPRHAGNVSHAPTKVKHDLSPAGSVFRYVLTASSYAIRGGKFSLIYCAHLNLLPIASLIARSRRVPLVLAIYGIDAWSAPRHGLQAGAARTCRHVVSISSLTLQRFQAWAGDRQTNAIVLPNAVHLEQYGLGDRAPDLVSALGLSDRRVVMTFGRMATSERYKGFDEVIEALPQLVKLIPELVYLALGDGDDRARLERRAMDLGLAEHVVFAGFVPENRKADYLRLADLFVMPSSGEGFGFVVLEALACGIPVVASKTDGTREATRDGMLGELVDPNHRGALVDAILRGLARPKRIPNGLAYFSYANFAARVDTVLAEIAGVGSCAKDARFDR